MCPDSNHQPGRIFQINMSKGGVPKQAVQKAEVTSLGLLGDLQANTEIHGGLERALCLYSLERILALQEEGHTIFPGAIGENLTLVGLDWPSITPGSQVQLGGQVLLEITRYTTPCNTLTPFFLDGDYGRVSNTKYPGWSRVYARVLQGGWLSVGDQVGLQ